MKVTVYHEGYGCDTGCCGHVVRIDDAYMNFHFSHPYSEDHKAWALDLARIEVEKAHGVGHAFDLDWDNCSIEND